MDVVAGFGFDMPQSEVAEPMDVAQAIDLVFRGCAAPNGVVRGALLVDTPPWQKRMLLACGVVKACMTASTFLPIFTHGSYTPPHCEAPWEEWPVPERGSIAYEWSLCCGSEYLLGVATSTFFVGCFVGSFCGGMLVDRLGRRDAMIYGVIANALSVLAAGFAPNIVVYAVCRFIAGVVNMATVQANFILATEWVPDRWRAPLSAYLFSCSALGEMLLVPLAAATEAVSSSGWRPLTLSMSLVCLSPSMWLCVATKESPQWLAGRDVGRAQDVLAMVARLNGDAHVAKALAAQGLRPRTAAVGKAPTSNTNPRELAALGSPEASSAASALPLLMALRAPATWAMALLWFTAAGVYFGISLAAGELSHGVPLAMTVLLSALSEIPAGLAAAWLLERPSLGRRMSTTALYALGGVCCATLALSLEAARPEMAAGGKFFVTAAFDGIYVYASEVFETAIRGSAIGICSCAARVASVLAPHTITILGVEGGMLVFGGLSLSSALVCRLLLPETVQNIPACGGKKEANAPHARDEAFEPQITRNPPLVSAARGLAADASAEGDRPDATGSARPTAKRPLVANIEMSRVNSHVSDGLRCDLDDLRLALKGQAHKDRGLE